MTAFGLKQVSVNISVAVTVTGEYQSDVSGMVTVSAARKRAVIFFGISRWCEIRGCFMWQSSLYYFYMGVNNSTLISCVA